MTEFLDDSIGKVTVEPESRDASLRPHHAHESQCTMSSGNKEHPILYRQPGGVRAVWSRLLDPKWLVEVLGYAFAVAAALAVSAFVITHR